MGSALHLPGSDLLFLVQEWRFPTSSIGRRLDLLSVDANTGQLVVIELKQKLESGAGASAQVNQYVGLLHAHRADLAGFFSELFEAMKGLYASDGQLANISVNTTILPRAEVWAPDGRVEIEGS